MSQPNDRNFSNLLIVTHTEICAWQCFAVKQIVSCVQDVYYRIIPGNQSIPKTSPLLKQIDRRFSQLSEDPFRYVTSVNFFRKLAVKNDDGGIELYDKIVLFCSDECHVLKGREIIRMETEYKNWYGAAIHRDLMSLCTISFQNSHGEWKILQQMSFRTLIGMYNNRDKALFYLGFLLKNYLTNSIVPSHRSASYKFSFQLVAEYYMGLLSTLIKRKIGTVKGTYWRIALIDGEVLSFPDMPANNMYADPFPILDGGDEYVFYEEVREKSTKGIISVSRLTDKIFSDTSVALEMPFHLSFPNVFRRGEAFYMIPEQSASQELAVYRSQTLRGPWCHYRTLLSGIRAVDPVWIYHQGRYWLFFNKMEDFEKENNERLYIYFSDDLFSDKWTAHKKNPVVIDISRARNAGHIFTENGCLYRTAQNCCESYGSQVVICRIDTLTPEHYKESEVSNMNHLNKYLGMHTYNQGLHYGFSDILVPKP